MLAGVLLLAPAWYMLEAYDRVENSRLNAFSRFLQQAIGSALLGVACWLLLQQTLTGGAGMLIIASLLGGSVVAPLVQLITQAATYGQVRDAWRELCRLMLRDADSLRFRCPKPNRRSKRWR